MGTKKAKRAGKAKTAKKTAKKVVARKPRPAAKKATRKKAAAKRARTAPAKPVAEVQAPDLRGDFLRLVSKLGSGEAQRLLDTFVEVETPRSS